MQLVFRRPVMLLVVSVLYLGGCQVAPQTQNENRIGRSESGIAAGTGTIAIPTIQVPKTLTSPTRHSERIRMGSASRAEDFLCRFMSNYTLVLNANFDATLNVFKHRAARMGADWIAIIEHSEVIAETEARENRPIYVLEDSTVLNKHDTLTKLQGALYDCK